MYRKYVLNLLKQISNYYSPSHPQKHGITGTHDFEQAVVYDYNKYTLKFNNYK